MPTSGASIPPTSTRESNGKSPRPTSDHVRTAGGRASRDGGEGDFPGPERGGRMPTSGASIPPTSTRESKGISTDWRKNLPPSWNQKALSRRSAVQRGKTC